MLDATKTGRCLCGAVSFRISGPMRQPHACHCETCRRLSGHFIAATRATWADVELVEDRGLRWIQTSDTARRGFCSACGSPLFWDDGGGSGVSIFMGALDDPSGFKIARHIFVDEKPDYYAIGDACPQLSGYGRDDQT